MTDSDSQQEDNRRHTRSKGRPSGSINNSSIKLILEKLSSNVEKLMERVNHLETKPSQEDIFDLKITEPTPIAHNRYSKLPQHRLPSYEGDVTQWNSFWQHYQQIIDSAPDHVIPPIEKFLYLKDCLKGEALHKIIHLVPSTENYALALEILHDNYADNSTVKFELLEKLQHIKTCRNDSTTELQRFTNELDSILTQLIPITHVDTETILALLKVKLPRWVIKELFTAYENNKRITATELLKKLRQTIRVLVTTEPRTEQELVTQSVRTTNNVRFSTGRFVQRPQPVSTLFSKERENYLPVTKLPCIFCGAVHSAVNCLIYKNVSDRINRLKDTNRCSKCTKLGHIALNCQVKLKCNECLQPHHLYLCPKKLNNTNQPWKHHEQSKSVNSSLISTKTNKESLTQTVLLKCCKGIVSNIYDSFYSSNALILIDEGSTTSYISSNLSKKLHLRSIKSSTVSFNIFSETNSKTLKTDLTSFNIHLQSGKLLEIKAFTIDHIAQPIPYGTLEERYKNKVAYDCQIPDILLGSDYSYQLQLRHQTTLDSGFHVFDSLCGPIVGGMGTLESKTKKNASVLLANSFKDKIAQFFSLETLGIKEELDTKYSLDDYKRSVRFDGERYEVSLPWKKFPPDLPTNYGLSYGRLKSNLKQLNKKPKLLQEYHEVIENQLRQNVIELINKENDETTQVHYIPHQPVVRRDNLKLRVVYDASSKTATQDNSLNDCLYTGPLLLKNLTGILLRFRLYPIVILADVEKAFLQISLNPRDRDFTRFLWIKSPKENKLDHNLVAYRFTRVVFGLTSSPFLLALVILTHFSKRDDILSQDIINNLYVDNIMLTAQDPSQAKNKVKNLRSEFKNMGMKVREFKTNCPSILSDLPSELKLAGEQHKNLGVIWNNLKDSIEFVINPYNTKQVTTKQSILSYIASFFDPMGILTPAILPLKLFLQNLWEDNLTWTNYIGEALENNWLKLQKTITNHTFSLPRKISLIPSTNLTHELHTFSDASGTAFACAVYLKSTDDQKNSSVSLIFSKAKVCPKRLKGTTIHKLELLGVLIAVRAAKFVLEEYKLDPILRNTLSSRLNIWTDSTTVLHWLSGSAKQEAFIQNRLNEVKSTKNLICRYVTSESNPADVASRGSSFFELSTNKRWFDGPKWLTQGIPQTPSNIPQFDSNKYKETSCQLAIISQVSSNKPIIDFNRFSSWERLLNSTGYVIRDKYKTTKKTYLTISEIKMAQIILIRLAQKESPPKPDEACSLNLFKDSNNLLRCKGRLKESLHKDNTKYPVWLPTKNRLTELYVYYTHKLMLHAGTLAVLNQIRLNYWIPQGRRTISRIINNYCLTCRKFKVKHYVVPDCPNLPLERVRPFTVFENSGIDYFGPFYVEDNIKIWGVLFTCMSSRAVHLEITKNLSAESFMNAFRRFVSRRGKPKAIISDNGTQFVLTKKILSQIKTKTEGKIEAKGIKWTFITERAPWKGGFYERLVGLVKHHTKRILNKTKLSYEQMSTILTEIEFILNCRPITFMPNSPSDLKPIRPIDFLSPNANTNMIIETELQYKTSLCPTLSTRERLLNAWKESNQKLSQFWKNWQVDYLLSLREREKKTNNRNGIIIPKTGDVVLVYEELLPRNKWKLAVVTENNDMTKQPSSLEIRTANNRITRRATKHLFPLEATE